jgi:hypothetical protein
VLADVGARLGVVPFKVTGEDRCHVMNMVRTSYGVKAMCGTRSTRKPVTVVSESSRRRGAS